VAFKLLPVEEKRIKEEDRLEKQRHPGGTFRLFYGDGLRRGRGMALSECPPILFNRTKSGRFATKRMRARGGEAFFLKKG